MQILRARKRLVTTVAASKSVHRFGLRFLCRRFLGDRSGSTAIEFVALALPFSLLVFAILESCLSFAGQQALANATDDIARQVRTGNLRPMVKNEVTGALEEITPAYVENKICAQIAIIVPGNCQDNLEVDLRKFDSFAVAADVRTEFTGPPGERDIKHDFIVKPGPSGTINMLRVYYRWPIITNFLRKSMSNLKDNKTLLFATATWQNEPFDD